MGVRQPLPDVRPLRGLPRRVGGHNLEAVEIIPGREDTHVALNRRTPSVIAPERLEEVLGDDECHARRDGHLA
eukprot:12406279-Alexandrium_andersonii.AAC.1